MDNATDNALDTFGFLLSLAVLAVIPGVAVFGIGYALWSLVTLAATTFLGIPFLCALDRARRIR